MYGSEYGRGESGRSSSARYGGEMSGVQSEMHGYRGVGPMGYKRSDERVQEEINDRLTDAPHIDASSIECRVQNGEVTLTGTVPNRETKRNVEELAESISGVKEVQNNLRVKKSDRMGSSSKEQSSSSSKEPSSSPYSTTSSASSSGTAAKNR